MIHDPALIKLVAKQTDLFNKNAGMIEKEEVYHQIQIRQAERLKNRDSDD